MLGQITLPLCFNDVIYNYNLHVIENLHHSIIIGVDFMEVNKVTIDFSNEQITLSDEAYVCPLITSTGLARASMPLKILKHAEYLVPVKISKRKNGEQVLLEPLPSLAKLNLMAARCLVTVSKGQAVLRLLNPSDKTVKISNNFVLAKVLDIDEASIHVLGADPDDSERTVDKSNSTQPADLDFDLSNSNLTQEQKHQLNVFLKNYRDVFANSLSELGVTDVYSHKIETVPDARPVRMPFYKTSPPIQKEIQKQVDEMLENGIIVPSNSDWHSAVCLVKRQNSNDFQFTIDYRLLNKICYPKHQVLPHLESVFDAIGAAQPTILSTLDLRSGFWQVPMDKETRHKAAFITQNGIFEWTRMPFGLMNAPTSFQTVMMNVLRGLTWKFALVYVDDILIFSRNFQEHLSHLDQVLSRLRKANLKLKPSKCSFAVREVKYLGHIISPEGIKADPDKFSAVDTFPVPKCPKHVRSFLGMTNYFRRFISSYPNITTPLYSLLEKKTLLSGGRTNVRLALTS